MVSADFYKVLGTDRSAEQDDIKKAFRSLALKTHPAKSTSSDSKDMFLKIAEAYHVLSDEQRKATYDQFGMDGLKKGVPARDGK
jgi:DnaJ family protein B protein 13